MMVKVIEGDLVYYQYQDKKAWLELAKVIASIGNDIFIFVATFTIRITSDNNQNI